MDRQFVVASAQMGPIARDEPRQSCVARMVAMLREAHGRGAKLVVFPELALTTFFPRWMIEDPDELAGWFEGEMPGPAARPLFEAAAEGPLRRMYSNRLKHRIRLAAIGHALRDPKL